ncbi:hypothetical protein K502DRAFT_349812 [Neoconidiobolus thromboides FSU 785]|nr:hypothetical protein K502DRAFT_349812 [Neoconidiobolus thromboides FSU 785]
MDKGEMYKRRISVIDIVISLKRLNISYNIINNEVSEYPEITCSQNMLDKDYYIQSIEGCHDASIGVLHFPMAELQLMEITRSEDVSGDNHHYSQRHVHTFLELML